MDLISTTPADFQTQASKAETKPLSQWAAGTCGASTSLGLRKATETLAEGPHERSPRAPGILLRFPKLP